MKQRVWILFALLIFAFSIAAAQEEVDLEERAFTVVEANEDWTPIEQDFDGTIMVLVPVGNFVMGSTAFELAFPDSTPHQQTVTEPYWIDKYEVTNAQFVDFLNAKGNRSADDFEYLDTDAKEVRITFLDAQWQVIDGFEQHPVTEVTWFAARDYCAWQGGRLLTELEWEYAAKGPSNRAYPWGDDWDAERVVWAENHPDDTNTVMVAQNESGASWVGALNMSGNVWEWLSTIVDNNSYENAFPYPYDATDGREDLSNIDTVNALRGGSWSSDEPVNLRTAYRNLWVPNGSSNGAGIRCGRSLGT